MYRDEEPRPRASTLMLHAVLLVVTFITTTIAGTLFPFGRINSLPDSDPGTASEAFWFILSIPERYVAMIVSAVGQIMSDRTLLTDGLSFSVSLLLILIAHEMGHYVACRLYRVDATLPFFIPTPPMIGPAGTFGAFIKIKSPMPSRKAVFDIGVAGPIAGFIMLIPIAIIGVATMHTVSPAQAAAFDGGLHFSDPIFIRGIAAVLGKDVSLGVGNPFYFAAWVGLLVTALNLIPSGQLDGGHAVYAVFGERVHYWTGRIAFPVMAALAVMGWYLFNSPSGVLVAVLLAVMMRVRHPEPWDISPLDAKRKAVAFLVLLIFGVSFLPFPITIS